MARTSASIFSRDLALAAVRDSFPKLDPRLQVRNPVMFIVELGSVITTGIFVLDLARGHTGQLWFVGSRTSPRRSPRGAARRRRTRCVRRARQRTRVFETDASSRRPTSSAVTS